MMSADPRRHAPATLRNRDAILTVLRELLPPSGRVLEIASGSGEHAAYLAPRLKNSLIWAPSDRDPDALAGIDSHAADVESDRIEPAQELDVSMADWAPVRPIDAIFCANMIHIAPWDAGLGLFAGAGRLLPAGGPLILYGPFKREGVHTATSNASFDDSLRARDPSWGVRDLDRDVIPSAQEAGLSIAEMIEMPANNMIIAFRRAATP